MNQTHTSQLFLRRTRFAYVATRVLDTPFWAIYNMLPFILYKDLHASPAQLAAIITLKPLVSIFSMYWSATINKRSDRLVPNILWARLLGYLPFLLFPFTDNPWYLIAAFGTYMMLQVGTVPAWMEILKLNIPGIERERVFSYTQAFGYMGGGLLPFAMGWFLDEYFQAWRLIFPVAACLGLAAAFFQFRILIPKDAHLEKPSSLPFSLKDGLLKPWKNVWNLLVSRPDFGKFQTGFMLVGSGLMIVQPALPVYFVDVLHLSYTELTFALTLCKGIGFALAAPLWTRWIHQYNIFRFSSIISALACLFPLFLIAASFHLYWLYIGYFIYGLVQSGNELAWNMSGPLFAKQEESSVFTSVNVVTVGLRGCVVPAVGSWICAAFNSPPVMLFSGFLCLAAALRFSFYSQQIGDKLEDPVEV